MLSAVLTSLLAAAPSLALPKVTGVGLEPGEAGLYANLLSAGLRSRGFTVVMGEDMAVVLGAERQRQLLGCAESCLGEIAAALGTDGVLVAHVGILGSTYSVTARVVSSKDASVLAETSTVATAAQNMPKALEQVAWALTTKLTQVWKDRGLTPGVDPSAPPKPASLRVVAVVPAALGAVAAGVGLALRINAGATYETLLRAQSVEQAERLRTVGQTEQTVGFLLLCVGGAGLVTGLLLGLLLPDAPASVSLVPTPTGVLATLGWAL